MGTHYKGTPREKQALSAYINLTRACESLSERIHEHLTAENLGPTEFAVLEALLHLGPLRQHAIAEKILKTRGNVTQVIDKLEKRGLTQRKTETCDRRCTTVSLTAAGKKLIAPVFKRHAEVLCREMSLLSQDEQESLRIICRKLGKGGSKT